MNIIINGGTRGIGKELAHLMAQDKNNQLIVTGRDKQSLDVLSNRFNNIHPLKLDLSLFDDQVETFRENVFSHFEKVDILINMAGLLVAKDFIKSTNTDARLMMETNFFGPASVIRIIKPRMAKGSHIVNISSMGGFQGSSKYRGLSYYSASKAALACLTECLAVEFIDEEICINCLALGAVQTEMFNTAFPGLSAPVQTKDIAEYISGFAIHGHKFYNGKILPVAFNNP